LLNTDTGITRQLMRTARTLEAKCGKVLQESLSKEVKKDESGSARVWAAEFHHVTAHSRLADVLKLTDRLFL
jgi:hypothetical protein